MQCYSWLILCLLLTMIPALAANQTQSEPIPEIGFYESALISELFEYRKYDNRVRPVMHPSNKINVSFVLDLYQIISVDGKSQSISLFCWVYEYWHDERLFWNPDDYGGLDQLSLNHGLVWTPDTTLINNIQMDRAQVENRQRVVVDLVKNAPTQVFIPCTAQYTVGCLFNVQYFPFDIQNCTLTFASWSYDVTKIDYFLPNTQGTFEAYQESDEWDILSFDIHKELIRYDCCPRPYAMIFAHLVIRRKPLYYVVNLVLPTLIISLIATVGLFASSSNKDGKEDKVNLGITTLLALSILLLTVSDQIPKGSTSVPLLGWFYLVIMLHLSFETLAAVYLSYPRNERRVADLLSFLCRAKLQVKRPLNRQDHSPCQLNNNNAHHPVNPRPRVLKRQSSAMFTKKALVKPANFCMVVNIVITIAVTLAAFLGGMIQGASSRRPPG